MASFGELEKEFAAFRKELGASDSELVHGTYKAAHAVQDLLEDHAANIAQIHEEVDRWKRNDRKDKHLIRASEIQDRAVKNAPTPLDISGEPGEPSLEYWIEKRLINAFERVEDELLAYRETVDPEDRGPLDQLISDVEGVAEAWHGLRAYIARAKPSLRGIDLVKAQEAEALLEEAEKRAQDNIARLDVLLEAVHPDGLGRFFRQIEIETDVGPPGPPRVA